MANKPNPMASGLSQSTEKRAPKKKFTIKPMSNFVCESKHLFSIDNRYKSLDSSLLSHKN